MSAFNKPLFAELRKAKLIADVLGLIAAAAETDRTTVITQIAEGNPSAVEAYEKTLAAAEMAQKQRDENRATAPQEAAAPGSAIAAWRQKFSEPPSGQN